MNASARQAIPPIRWTHADIIAAEEEIRAAFKKKWGPLCEPGLVWLRGKALELLAQRGAS